MSLCNKQIAMLKLMSLQRAVPAKMVLFFAEVVAKDAAEVRKKISASNEYANLFYCEIDELVDMRKVTEEMKSAA